MKDEWTRNVNQEMESVERKMDKLTNIRPQVNGAKHLDEKLLRIDLADELDAVVC